jgi:hypothetical protein
MEYAIHGRALEKWSRERLELLEETESGRHYRFRYDGSTCNDGGTPYTAWLHLRLSGKAACARIDEAWIEIPAGEREAASAMCAAGSDPGFLDTLCRPAAFTGSGLEEALEQGGAVNHAGCFCTPAMLWEKWRQALSTVHWRENGAG